MLEIIKGVFFTAEVIVGLGMLIFIHEFGHFLMAKRNGVRVETFSLGFGQAIFKWRRGETEYRIAWIPLGGYVKMAGETVMDEHRGEPWELTSKGAWPRLQIFAAGALMNLIIAFPIAILAFLVGMYELSTEVGVPALPEMKAGMLPGDVILEVDGRRIDNMDKYRIEMVRRSTGRQVPVKVRRGDKVEELTVVTMESSYHATYPPINCLKAIAPDSPAARAGLREGDEIVSANGKPILHPKQLQEILRGSPGRPVRLDVRRRNSSWNETLFDVTLTPVSKDMYVIPEDDHVRECVVGRVYAHMPATGVLEPDDDITHVDGREIRSYKDLKEAVEPSAGRPLKMQLTRKGASKSVEITPTYGDIGQGVIGFAPKSTRVFAQVLPGSYFDKAGIRQGDKLISVGKSSGNVTIPGEGEVEGVLNRRSVVPLTIEIQVERGDEKKTIPLALEKTAEGEIEGLGFRMKRGMLSADVARPFRRRGLGDAIRAGLYEPYDVGVMTFEMLRKIFARQESAKGFSGPVGIMQVSYKFAELSFGNLLWILVVITVSLGIFNLLPIPILDGGHVLLLMIEKLRGKPHTERFLIRFQYVGLLFLLTLVVLVTYNDILRLFGGG